MVPYVAFWNSVVAFWQKLRWKEIRNRIYAIIDYRLLTTETKLNALYIFHCLFSTSLVKLFVVNVHVFVYNIVGRKKKKKTLAEPFTFWKWKHISKNNHNLKTKGHFETNS